MPFGEEMRAKQQIKGKEQKDKRSEILFRDTLHHKTPKSRRPREETRK